MQNKAGTANGGADLGQHLFSGLSNLTTKAVWCLNHKVKEHAPATRGQLGFLAFKFADCPFNPRLGLRADIGAIIDNAINRCGT